MGTRWFLFHTYSGAENLIVSLKASIGSLCLASISPMTLHCRLCVCLFV